MSHSPYIVGLPVTDKDFYGRTALINDILANPNRLLHVLGMRRIGKTSLLKRLETQVSALYLDLQSVADWRELQRAFISMIRRNRRTITWLDSQTLNNCQDIFELLEELDTQALEHEQILWLLVDETDLLDKFIKYDVTKFQKFISYLQNLSHLKWIFTSAKQLVQLDELLEQAGSYTTFLDLLSPPIYMPTLTTEESLTLITQRGQYPIPAAIIEAICHRTHCHPYYVQMLSHYLWQNHPPLQFSYWNVKDLDYTIDSSFERALALDYAYLSEHERTIMQAVLRQQELPSLPNLQTYLNGLTYLGYLQRVGQDYLIGNDFLKNWLMKQYQIPPSQISAEATLRQYQKTEAEQDKLRQLIQHKFPTREQLYFFIYDHFAAVHAETKPNQAQIQPLLDYCHKHHQIEKLRKLLS